FVDDFGDLGVFVAFAVDDVAPVAPDGADVEEHGFVFRLRAFERRLAPFMPINRLACGGAQIGASGVFQPVFTLIAQTESFHKRGRGNPRPYKTSTEQQRLLDGVAGAEVARVERFAVCESFVLAMIKTDAVLAELPAEIDVLLIDDGGKIKEADVEVLDEASGFENAVERGLQRFSKLLVLRANRSQFLVGDDHAA